MATFPTPESRYTPPPDVQRILLAEELSEIAERAQSFTGASGAIIAMRRRHELVVRTSNGVAPEVGTCIPLPSGVTGLSVTTRKPQTCASADAEAQLEAAFRAISVRSVLSVPVQWDGEVRGVLTVLSQLPEAFNRTHIAILMTLRDVIANKLSQCEMPSDLPRQDATPLIELDVDSLLQAPPPQPTVVAPQPAPAPPRSTVLPAQAPAPAVQARVEPAAAIPAVSTEAKPPQAPVVPLQPTAKPLAALFKPAPEPVAMSPDVLCPSEDPSKYGSVKKTKLAASLPVSSPPVARATTTAVSTYSPVLVTYRTPAKSGRKNMLVFVGPAAAVIVLGLAIALYPRHKPHAAFAAVNAVSQEASAPAPAPALVAVPLPKSAGEQPLPPAPPKTDAYAATPARHQERQPAAVEPKRSAEETTQRPAPVLHLAAAQPAAKSEEPVEPPPLAIMAANNALPALPTTTAPAPSLAVRKSVLVPATLVQGRAPQYPEVARLRGISGIVKLQVSVSANGKVTDVVASSGEPLLRQAAIAAVRGWIYRPAYLDGNPVPSTAEVSLRFTPPK